MPANEGNRALLALKQAFELELARSTISSLDLIKGMSIVAIVGEGMALTTGVSSTFMASLARANVNIRQIAQGSTELQIAVVVSEDDTTRALRAAHMAFTLSEAAASVTLLGACGQIGSALVEQFQSQKKMLSEELGVKMCVNIIANSQKMVMSKDSLGLDKMSEFSKMLSAEDAMDCDLDVITNTMAADVNPLRVIVDCTNNEMVSEYYERWLEGGIHIISPGRKFGSGDLERYRRVCQIRKENSVEYLVESSVGSALPVLTTLRDLMVTGDKIKRVSGCLSGTMAYIVSTISDDVLFSEAVQKAVDKGYAENDLKEDLSGLDMTRKVVILAREMGLSTKIEDVEVESLLPENLESCQDKVSLLEGLKTMDSKMLDRFKAAEKSNKHIRYKFEIDNKTGKVSVSLVDVPISDPLFRLERNENLVAFETQRYETSPLIVKGAAAGPDLAAAGIFADLLRLTRAYSSNQN